MSKQSSSDPLPYVQIDRAAEPTFALLAGKLKVTHQHAIGALYEFWKLCGDPRELEAVVAATPANEEPELLLTPDDVALRFELASGCKVEPVVLARLGILEERDHRFRVRGMSRSFEPIVKRLRARSVAALGGKASAESRRTATGSAQPVGGKGFKPRSDAGSDVGQAEPNGQPKQNGTDNRTETEPTAEAEPNPSGQRSAVSVQRLLEEEAPPSSSGKPPLQFDLAPPDSKTPLESWTRQDFWRWAECKRREAGLPQERWPNESKLRDWWQEARPAADVAVLQETYLRFGDQPKWQQATPPLPFAAFMSMWNQYLPLRKS